MRDDTKRVLTFRGAFCKHDVLGRRTTRPPFSGGIRCDHACVTESLEFGLGKVFVVVVRVLDRVPRRDKIGNVGELAFDLFYFLERA